MFYKITEKVPLDAHIEKDASCSQKILKVLQTRGTEDVRQ